MDLKEFIERVIDEGIDAAKADYTDESDRLKGALEGFELCRGKSPVELEKLLQQARKEAHQAYLDEAANYWELRCREGEIEWVCNCVSAVLQNQGFPVIVTPTARGVFKAAEIVGVK